MQNATQKNGKVRYIEPNHIIQDKAHGYKNGDGNTVTNSYNIPWNQDDFCSVVDLVVNIPSRMGTAVNEEYTFSLFENDGKVSFFSGTDGLMTDMPGSTTYYDVINKDFGGTKESLGITNINITYNSYFYPEVTINFTDVRGAALMMPHEENYRGNTINATRTDEDEKFGKVENFFAALFSFPYPEFKLRVKGFYGKVVEYSLLVSDFRSSFNSQTGNFDATVKFIGKMYGVYTDIPMSFLLAAPYCKYGSTNNLSIWESNNFQLDGVRMPTLIELRKILIEAHHNLKTDITYTRSEEYAGLKRRLNSLEYVKGKYNEYVSKLSNTAKDTKHLISDSANHTFFFIADKGSNSFEYLEKKGELKRLRKELIESVKTYNSAGHSTKLPYPNGEDIIDKTYLDLYYHSYIDFTDTKNGVYVSVISYDTLTRYSDYYTVINNIEVPVSDFFKGNSHLINSITSKVESYWDVMGCYVYDAHEFITTINNNIKDTQDEITALKKELDANYTEIITALIGFKPSIKNVFSIIMAHLQTFMQIFDSFLSNVRGVNARSMLQYGLSSSNTDVENYDDRDDLPPFPLITDGNGIEVYPPHLKLDRMEEEDLIDAFFDSTFAVLAEDKKIDEYEKYIKDNSLGLIPSNMTDLVVAINPYAYVFDNAVSTIKVDYLLMFLGIRLINHLFYERKNNVFSSEAWGKTEAFNFWRFNKLIPEELLNKLKANEFNANNFLAFMKGEKCPYIQDVPPYADNADTKCLLVEEGNRFRVNKHNMPPVINNLAEYYSDLRSNDITRVVENGTLKGTQRPTAYIQLIEDESYLKTWLTEYKSYDCSKVLTDSQKNLLFQDMSDISKTHVCFREEEYFEGYWRGQVYFTTKDDYTTLTFSDMEDYQPIHSIKLKNYLKDKHDNTYQLENIMIQDGKDKRYSFFLCKDKTYSVEQFLMEIPHDWGKIRQEIIDGKGYLRIPEITKLCLGMMMDKYVNNKTWFNQKSELGGLYGKICELTVFLYEKIGGKDSFGFMDAYYRWLNDNYKGWAGINDYYRLKFKTPKEKDNDELIDVLNGIISLWKGYSNSYVINVSEKAVASRGSFNVSPVYFGGKYPGEVTLDECLNMVFVDFTKKYKAVLYKDDYVFLRFNDNSNYFSVLNDLFVKSTLLINPFSLQDMTGEYYVNKEEFTSAFQSFKKTLLEFFESSKDNKKDEKNDYANFNSDNITLDSKLSMYRTLKNLYDRHLHGIDMNLWNVNEPDSEMKRFHFIDSFYNDIGNELTMNVNQISNLINMVMNHENYVDGSGDITKEMSVYSFMTKVCEKNNCMLLSLPVFNGTFDRRTGSDMNMEEMFTPYSYGEALASHVQKGPAYICLYPHKPSEHLPIPHSRYKDDGFNLSPYKTGEDQSGTASFSGELPIPDLMNESEQYVIPAFGVEYGVQNQSYFKNVNVNMDNPQVTEHSIKATFSIAGKDGEAARGVNFEGQDLYQVYSNHSYTCNVEMMGCAQIMPLMYFQLNNIPMFRGAYQIIRVEHNISPGNMTTNFTGVRMNKTKIPMVSAALIFNDYFAELDANVDNNSQKDNARKSHGGYTGPFFGDVNNGLLLPEKGMKDGQYGYTYDDLIAINNGKFIKFGNITTHDGGPKGAYNDLNPELRRLFQSIATRASKVLGGIIVNSATRTKESPSKSDHNIRVNNSNKHAARRNELTGKNINGVETTFADMGCAIDFLALDANKNTDKIKNSIALFEIVALEYTDGIRQLIWEMKKISSTAVNSISHVIHLASYGQGDNNDKREIFVAEGDKYKPVKADNDGVYSDAPTNLPDAFLRIMYRMFETGKNKDVKFINFPNGGDDLTKEIIGKWIGIN